MYWLVGAFIVIVISMVVWFKFIKGSDDMPAAGTDASVWVQTKQETKQMELPTVTH